MSTLQRTRSSLQFLRSTSQNEIKRKEREVERVLERWTKLQATKSADVLPLCLNSDVGGESPGPIWRSWSRDDGLLEVALEQAEQARSGLQEENHAFRLVLLELANALRHARRDALSKQDKEVPDDEVRRPSTFFLRMLIMLFIR
jgi:hypothetical protein